MAQVSSKYEEKKLEVENLVGLSLLNYTGTKLDAKKLCNTNNVLYKKCTYSCITERMNFESLSEFV